MTSRQIGAALLAALILIAPVRPAGAALGDHIWSMGNEAGGHAGIDGSNFVVAHGAFFGTMDFGGGPLTAGNALDGDLYLARYDAAGNHVWSQQFTPAGSGGTNDYVAVDPAGNIYITGIVFTSIDFGGGAIAGQQLYIAKFDANGTHQWSAGYGDGWPRAIVATATHVAVAGYTSAGMDFGGGTIGTAGGTDIVVARFTAAGGHVWSAAFGDAANQGAMALDMDAGGSIAIAGAVNGSADFGGGTLNATNRETFVAAFDPAGAHQWSALFATHTSGTAILVNVGVGIGPSGEIVLAGEKNQDVDFGGGTLGTVGSYDAYVASFTGAGAHQWSNGYGSTAADQPHDVSIDASGNVLVTGTYGGDMDCGGGSIGFAAAAFSYGLFLALYDDAGGHLFSHGYGASIYTADNQFAPGGDILVSGAAADVDMGGGSIAPAYFFAARLEGAGGAPSAIGGTPALGARVTAYPNPFNPRTTIRYALDAPGPASLQVYDVRGHLVENLVAERWHAADTYTVPFHARASGVYFARLRTPAGTRTIKLVAIK